MTKKEAAIIQAFTGYTMLIGDDWNIFLKFCEYLFGRPIYTHELPKLSDELKELSRPYFEKICKNLK